MHWDWDRDFGWHALGTRRDQFNFNPAGIEEFIAAHSDLGESCDLFGEILAEPLEKVFQENPRYQRFQELMVFTEFFGPQSFAGRHKPEDVKELRLFDVWAEGCGFVAPRDFVNDFSQLPIARLIYDGKLTGTFADDVRNGKYDVNEGVVCKGSSGDELWMAKIKTHAYQERLKKAFRDRWEDYWE